MYYVPNTKCHISSTITARASKVFCNLKNMYCLLQVQRMRCSSLLVMNNLEGKRGVPWSYSNSEKSGKPKGYEFQETGEKGTKSRIFIYDCLKSLQRLCSWSNKLLFLNLTIQEIKAVFAAICLDSTGAGHTVHLQGRDDVHLERASRSWETNLTSPF